MDPASAKLNKYCEPLYLFFPGSVTVQLEEAPVVTRGSIQSAYSQGPPLTSGSQEEFDSIPLTSGDHRTEGAQKGHSLSGKSACQDRVSTCNNSLKSYYWYFYVK
ncbi:hypothetical protein CC2G_001930 [Coprinopsis cinerea AmutBmut pab1-1]|nr:hypothetical protein CC2G_001930 [Coprinopsis cinerea AmutBmut pab1-1]